ncbi:MAG: MerR family transcriptional regulator [Acidobacteriota bacterium]|nr:MerR family transcriptional regulator [Acidobacteriota bacterium]
MATISALARESGLSRSTLLYYDRLGLLKPSRRSRSGYRMYSSLEVERLEQICLYRQMGIPLKEIGQLLDSDGGSDAAEILRRRLRVLNREIAAFRKQQRYILEILKQKQLQQGVDMISKERWVDIMRAAGLNDQDMQNWHRQFEKMEPEAHQEFLESLGIKAEEIAKIREWSRRA